MDNPINRAPLFAALDVEAAAALRASMTEVRARKGQVIFVEGEPGDRLYVIVEGKVTLGHSASDGRETLLAVLGPGEMFGELSLFDPGRRTATATALTDAVVLGLGNEQLRPWLASRPEVAPALLQALLALLITAAAAYAGWPRNGAGRRTPLALLAGIAAALALSIWSPLPGYRFLAGATIGALVVIAVVTCLAAMWTGTPWGWHALLSTSLNLHLLHPAELTPTLRGEIELLPPGQERPEPDFQSPRFQRLGRSPPSRQSPPSAVILRSWPAKPFPRR